MTPVVFSIPAKRDLREILAYIARDNRRNGERFLSRIAGKCQELADAPDLGNPLHTFPGILVWQIQKYVIVYRRRADDVEVLRIIHGARDWLNELGGETFGP